MSEPAFPALVTHFVGDECQPAHEPIVEDDTVLPSSVLALSELIDQLRAELAGYKTRLRAETDLALKLVGDLGRANKAIALRDQAITSLTDTDAQATDHLELAQLRTLVEAQGKVVSAARKYGEVVRTVNGIKVPWEPLDELLTALAALDKATAPPSETTPPAHRQPCDCGRTECHGWAEAER